MQALLPLSPRPRRRYASPMWGHEYEQIRRKRRRQALLSAGIFVTVLAFLAIPVASYFSLSGSERELLAAARSGDVDRARAALDAGASPQVTDRRGHTPLHVAAWHGRLSVARALVRAGADVNARAGDSGETPLHFAVRANRPDMALLLLGAGARSSLRTLDRSEPDIRGQRHPGGLSARDLAESAGFEAVAAVLGGARPAAEPEPP